MRKRPKLTENQFDKFVDELRGWISESVSPFQDDTPVKQAERIAKGEHDLLYFLQTYLPHYFDGQFGEFHGEWQEVSELEDQCAFVGAPREHGKSTFFTLGVPLHDVAYKLKRFLLIISDTNDQATGFTVAIRAELEDNPRLRHDFGDLMPPIGRRTITWKKNDFLTSNGVRVLARGRGEKVRGLKNRQHRPDRAIVDDFENDENVENPALVTKGKRWLKRAVIGSMGKGFSFIMVGNLFHPKSVLAQFIAERDDETHEKLYFSRVYAAILDINTPNERPLWPAAWPMERLRAKKRQMGTVDFNAEMMNLTGAENSPFREGWIVYYEPQDLAGKSLRVESFCDPSAASGEANDYKANVTVALDADEMVFYVRHAWIRHASPGAMFAACYAQVDHYGGQMGIEENMLKDFLHEAIQNYAKAVGRYLPWIAVHHSSNKEARIIGTLSYLVEHGKLRFQKGQSDQDLLVEQLIFILNKNINDDGPDALEGAVSLLQKNSGSVVSVGDEPEERRRGVMPGAVRPGNEGREVNARMFKRGEAGRFLRNLKRGNA